MTIHQVCKRAGVTILKQPPGAGSFKVGETLAVGTISSLVYRRGALKSRQILEVITAAKIAPLPAALIKAVEELMSNADYSAQVDPGDITTMIRADLAAAEAEAKIFAATHNVPLWKALTSVMFRRVKRGRRRAA